MPFLGRLCYVPSTNGQSDIGDEVPVACLGKRNLCMVVKLVNPPDYVFECLYTQTLVYECVLLDLQGPTLKGLDRYNIPSVADQIAAGQKNAAGELAVQSLVYHLPDTGAPALLQVPIAKMYFLQHKLPFDGGRMDLVLRNKDRTRLVILMLIVAYAEERIKNAVESFLQLPFARAPD